MPVSQRRINIELLLGISATFLSLAALIVSIFQTKIAREQQQKTVLPYLQIRHEIVNNSLHIILENEGVGPAFIKAIEVNYGTKNQDNYPGFLLDTMEELSADLDSVTEAKLTTRAKTDSVLKINKRLRIAIDWNEGGKDADAIYPGSAIKEGEKQYIYQFDRKGQTGGPFVEWARQLTADSTYKLQVSYSDVYGNCWQLIHQKNRNKVTELGSCPE